jgi:hypothetical protein
MPPKKMKQSSGTVEPNVDIESLKKAIAQPDLSNEAKDKALYEFAAKRCDKNKRQGVNKLGKAVKAAGKTNLADIDDLAGFLRGLIHTNDPNRFAKEDDFASWPSPAQRCRKRIWLGGRPSFNDSVREEIFAWRSNQRGRFFPLWNCLVISDYEHTNKIDGFFRLARREEAA